MIISNNPLGQDPMDFNEKTSADRVGSRIRSIRMAKGITQVDLGRMVGLTGDRIQKYENGARKPKADMLKQISSALGVSTLALTDPVTTNYIGAMYAMFELERTFGMKIEMADENHVPAMYLTATFRDNIYEYMKEWYDVYSKTQTELKSATTEEEKKAILTSYHKWEWNFPQGIVDRIEKNVQKARIKRKIDELQEAYDQLEQDEKK